MALTTDQWFARLKSFYPTWFTSQVQKYQVAHMYGIAKTLSILDEELDDHLEETFISTAGIESLTALGNERSVYQQDGEDIETFRLRVKSLVRLNGKPSIKALLDALLTIGEATVIPDHEGTFFASRGNFATRGEIVITPCQNAFSVIIDNQGESNAFYIGLSELISSNKAFGTQFRFTERVVP